MSAVAPSILRALGAELRVIHSEPSGKNINAACGAVHLEALLEAMKSTRADFGVAFDGDGDRSMFVSSSGRRIDGDAVLLMMARRLKRFGRLNPPVVVGTSMTNFALEKMLGAEGINLTRVGVGDRFVFEEMQRSGSILGGEPAGHIIFSDFRLSGDGLLTTLKLAETLVEEHASLDDLTRDWAPSPHLLKGVRVKKKVPLGSVSAVQTKIAEVEEALQGCGRAVVRYSGTEPLLRVMIESDDASRNESLMDDLLAVIREHIEIA
jgi:phosphoglucosamine mutase